MHLSAMFLVSLSLSFLISNMAVIIALHRAVVKKEMRNKYHVLSAL